ncbi:HK97 gp10 family phage protein [Blautia sp.]|uniref:HK97 gp10 family phage protein n=1 Tax=Blautia sp. TaxID=1955243 RepID=UPI0025838311|nr:HK97 gp10 family phage protein [Blautia sp.]
MIVRFEFDGGIDKFISGAQRAEGMVTQMEEHIVKQAGMAGLQNVASNVLSKTGRLKQSLTVGGTENIFDVTAGGGHASVRYGSNCPYVVPVEEGYNQSNRVSKATGRKPSLWVPGSGSGSNFSYNPGAKTGMKLSGRFVAGQHMFEKSIPDTKEDFKEITKREVERLFNALF